MGCTSSKSAATANPTARPAGDLREELVWERTGRAFDECYEAIKDVGSGAFASVIRCRTRPGGNLSLKRSESENSLTSLGDDRHVFRAARPSRASRTRRGGPRRRRGRRVSTFPRVFFRPRRTRGGRRSPAIERKSSARAHGLYGADRGDAVGRDADIP